jgi:hypothetical protein
MAGERCIHHGLGWHDAVGIQISDIDIRLIEKFCGRGPRQHGLCEHGRVGEFGLKAATERDYETFRGVLQSGQRQGVERHHRCDVNDRAFVVLDKPRQDGAPQARRSSDIESDGSRRVGIRHIESAGQHPVSGIVDEHRYCPARTKSVLDLQWIKV